MTSSSSRGFPVDGEPAAANHEDEKHDHTDLPGLSDGSMERLQQLGVQAVDSRRVEKGVLNQLDLVYEEQSYRQQMQKHAKDIQAVSAKLQQLAQRGVDGTKTENVPGRPQHEVEDHRLFNRCTEQLGQLQQQRQSLSDKVASLKSQRQKQHDDIRNSHSGAEPSSSAAASAAPHHVSVGRIARKNRRHGPAPPPPPASGDKSGPKRAAAQPAERQKAKRAHTNDGIDREPSGRSEPAGASGGRNGEHKSSFFRYVDGRLLVPKSQQEVEKRRKLKRLRASGSPAPAPPQAKPPPASKTAPKKRRSPTPSPLSLENDDQSSDGEWRPDGDGKGGGVAPRRIRDRILSGDSESSEGLSDLSDERPNRRAKRRRLEQGSDEPQTHDDTSDKVYEARMKEWLEARQGDMNSEVEVELPSRESVHGAVIPESVYNHHQQQQQGGRRLRMPRWLWESLYSYQQDGVRWLWGLHVQGVGGLLGDEMGLGKTVQTAAFIAALHHSSILQEGLSHDDEFAGPERRSPVPSSSSEDATHSKGGGVLIACPATMVKQWENELHTWFPPLRVCIFHQKGPKGRVQAAEIASSQCGVLLTSYESLRPYLDLLLDKRWHYVILDEGQRIRNPDAAITQAVKRFDTSHRLIMSGSPIQNNLRELWSLFDFCFPGRLGTLPVFIEEFAEPIRLGGYLNASQARVQAGYRCAVLLRELTQPYLLRRSKKEVQEILQLPAKSEQVLFCNLSVAQYQVYVDFLTGHRMGELMQSRARAFFVLSVLRKICNHPDLLLLDEPEDGRPEDFGNPARSGKMQVLKEIFATWHRDGHRVLVFCQTVQMLKMICSFMTAADYTFIRMDGQTAIKERAVLIDSFNSDTSIFAMVLTTRVGGVGLNLIGADRVVIFDPDWNPMTDVQARERAWRIGQTREVTVYRLLSTGTLEEKIYHRQIFKHFLSQKVLDDPKQRRFFKWNDLQELFDMPPPPPGFDPETIEELPDRYRELFKRVAKSGPVTATGTTTTDAFTSAASQPLGENHQLSQGATEQHNQLLETLFSKQGVQTAMSHDRLETSHLDSALVNDDSKKTASRALAALKKAQRERQSYGINVPTWTGRHGRAGAPPGSAASSAASRLPGKAPKESPATASLLAGLKKLSQTLGATGTVAAPSEPPPSQRQTSNTSEESRGEEAEEVKTHSFEMEKGRELLEFFHGLGADKNYTATTGEVLEEFGARVPSFQKAVFKQLLKGLCTFHKSTGPTVPGRWILKEDYR
ncbi:unnamed protein product [Vitrella brassicaformis CCMP3155]|uniref:DNA excision repair protein ERCC-6 n=3 Tax=Vitrella brassicaformis TaxID=1169539 RepID=A0A0G4EEC5_VITBC|nr:unnamed protein product [Vitrella brassicaformis CCMP3155]|eukprot:CEL93910.1 unnamed protein product [Vitrella brassicaformis CCMP3155]